MAQMKIKRLPNTAFVKQVAHLSINGMEFTAPDDFYSLLEELVEGDYGDEIVITNREVRDVLEKAGLLHRSIRGHCWGNAKLRKALPKILAALDKKMPDAKPRTGKKS